MKFFKAIAVVAVCTGLMIGTNSCLHVVHQDNARQGWYKKNPNNPHHPNTTNPGHTKAPKQSKGKAKKAPKK